MTDVDLIVALYNLFLRTLLFFFSIFFPLMHPLLSSPMGTTCAGAIHASPYLTMIRGVAYSDEHSRVEKWICIDLAFHSEKFFDVYRRYRSHLSFSGK